MKKTALAGATQVQIGPFRELRMKKTAPHGIKDKSDTGHMELRMTKTALAGARQVLMGPFRGLRIKRPRHVEIKDENDMRHMESNISGL